MPEVMRRDGFRYFFYANEGSPREPPHIHVGRNDLEAKFWLRPFVRLAYNDGFDAKTLRDVLNVVEMERGLMERIWHEFFS